MSDQVDRGLRGENRPVKVGRKWQTMRSVRICAEDRGPRAVVPRRECYDPPDIFELRRPSYLWRVFLTLRFVALSLFKALPGNPQG
jgi:hypothetical protein